ncbi:MAG: dUTP diphosphatase [Spirochaetota bacterium]
MEQNLEIKVYRLNKNLPLPRYMSSGASGIDLYADVEEDIDIMPGSYRAVPAGIAVSIPSGYEAQIRPRSGLALEHGITLLNSPGTIDSDYRGEIKVLLINHGARPFRVKGGMRIAQMVIARVDRARIVEVEGQKELEVTRRNTGGFGHTGV